MKTNILALLSKPTDAFNQRLAPFHRPFDVPIKFNRHASVDLRRVVGLSHCQYVDHTWLELVGAAGTGKPPVLKRVDACLQELSANPSYYLNRRKKPDWIFYKVQDSYFVSDGHHRTVVGRLFLELNGLMPVVHGVQIKEVDPGTWAQAQRDGADGGPPARWQVPADVLARFKHDDREDAA